MTFDIDFVKIPYWFWGCLGAGSLWVVKAWADKRYQARTEPQTRQQIDDDERSLTNRILHSEQFKEVCVAASRHTPWRPPPPRRRGIR